MPTFGADVTLCTKVATCFAFADVNAGNGAIRRVFMGIPGAALTRDALIRKAIAMGDFNDDDAMRDLLKQAMTALVRRGVLRTRGVGDKRLYEVNY